MHVEILRPRDATELNNDGMSKLGDISTKQNRIYQFFRLLQFLFPYSFSNCLAVSCFSF